MCVVTANPTKFFAMSAKRKETIMEWSIRKQRKIKQEKWMRKKK